MFTLDQVHWFKNKNGKSYSESVLKSWSQSTLDNLSSVELKHYEFNDELVLLTGAQNYWQSDDFEVVAGTNDHKLLCRRIEMQICQRYLKISGNENPLIIRQEQEIKKDDWTYSLVIDVKDFQGKWVIVELDQNLMKTMRIVSERI